MRPTSPARRRSTAPATRSPRALSKEQRAENIAREIELILARAVPLGGTAGETYLAGRGLQVPDTPDLLFHPDLTYWDTRTGYPALIAIVRNAAGEQIAIHRTYLAPDGSGKADVPEAAHDAGLGCRRRRAARRRR